MYKQNYQYSNQCYFSFDESSIRALYLKKIHTPRAIKQEYFHANSEYDQNHIF